MACKRDLYQDITDQIIAQLESGCVPWLKPWKEGVGEDAMGLPRNAQTGRAYSGINVMILWYTGKQYNSPRWLTYKQAIECGGNVRKGEKGTEIVYFTMIDAKDKKTNEDKKIPVLRTYYVFNVEQCDNLPERVTKGKPLPPAPELDAMFKAFVDSTEARIVHGGDQACYSPMFDQINMPLIQAFKTVENYKATLLHELVHWTGAKTRLDRDLTKRFGSESYAAEELIAEIGAAYLCADLGIQGELRHAGYIQNWLKVLKNDKRAIITAASQASKAATFLNGLGAEEGDIAEAA